MGSIYKRNHFRNGEKIRQGQIWWVQFSRNGRKIRLSSGSTRREDAVHLLRKMEGQIAQGLPVSQKTYSVKMDELFSDELVDWQIQKRRTIRDLGRRINLHLLPFFRGVKAERITTADVRRFVLLRQEQNASSAEINRELAILRRAFTLGIENTKIFSRPRVPMLRENNIRSGFVGQERFLAVHHQLPEDLQPPIEFAYRTGWRIGEILNLRWPQVDFRAGFVRLEPGTTKSDLGRLFPFTEELKSLLLSQRAKTEALQKEGILSPWVFSRKGQKIRSFRRAWKSACKRAGIPGLLVHDLRRSAVRNLIAASVPERVCMMLIGHKTRSIFDRYHIVSVGDLKMAAQ